MTRRPILWAAGVGSGGAVLVLVSAGIYRMYAPGDLLERAGRAQRRWGPFIDPRKAPVTWGFIGRGLLVTLEAALISIALSLVIGIILALIRMARNPRLRMPGGPLLRIALTAPVSTLIQSVRSVPLFMLILYAYLGVPKLGLNMSAFWAGVGALTLYTSCVLAEIIRAGILSLDSGQFEAADSLGLSYFHKLRLVVLPQALRRMAPAVVSQLITLIKDTSLLTYITVIELTRRLGILAQLSFNPIEAYLVAGLMYFCLNFSLSRLVQAMETRPSGKVAGGAPPSLGIGSEDHAVLPALAHPSRAN